MLTYGRPPEACPSAVRSSVGRGGVWMGPRPVPPAQSRCKRPAVNKTLLFLATPCTAGWASKVVLEAFVVRARLRACVCAALHFCCVLRTRLRPDPHCVCEVLPGQRARGGRPRQGWPPAAAAQALAGRRRASRDLRPAGGAGPPGRALQRNPSSPAPRALHRAPLSTPTLPPGPARTSRRRPSASSGTCLQGPFCWYNLASSAAGWRRSSPSRRCCRWKGGGRAGQLACWAGPRLK